MFSTVEDIQCCGGYSVLWRIFSTVKDVQYCEGYSVLWRIFSTVKDVQYCEGYSVLWTIFRTFEGCSVLWRIFSVVEDVQYCGECCSVLCWMLSMSCSVMWRIYSIVEGEGVPTVLWGISRTMDDIQGRGEYTVGTMEDKHQYCGGGGTNSTVGRDHQY